MKVHWFCVDVRIWLNRSCVVFFFLNFLPQLNWPLCFWGDWEHQLKMLVVSFTLTFTVHFQSARHITIMVMSLCKLEFRHFGIQCKMVNYNQTFSVWCNYEWWTYSIQVLKIYTATSVVPAKMSNLDFFFFQYTLFNWGIALDAHILLYYFYRDMRDPRFLLASPAH